jgi:hypothetical protein
MWISPSSCKQQPIKQELRCIHDVGYYASRGPNLPKLCATCLSFEFSISARPQTSTSGAPLVGCRSKTPSVSSSALVGCHGHGCSSLRADLGPPPHLPKPALDVTGGGVP